MPGARNLSFRGRIINSLPRERGGRMSTPVLEIQWIRDRLSQWTAWHYRSGIADNGNPGVYVLAHFSEAPQSVDPICAEVVYVGEAHKAGRSLCDRWWEFDRSAFGKAYDNHAGGNTYR